MKLFTQNSKIKASGGPDREVYNFGITAGKEACPMAGECAKGCYAKQGAYVWGNVKPAFDERLKLTKTDEFVLSAIKELRDLQAKATRAGKKLVIRVHDSGDFYSLGYWKKWAQIMQEFPDVSFYAYTKMVPFFRLLKGKLPPNFIVIYSEGGKADRLIDTAEDRHSRVFSSLAELHEAGYANATKDDLVAIDPTNHKIGLVYHGAKSKEWNTAA